MNSVPTSWLAQLRLLLGAERQRAVGRMRAIAAKRKRRTSRVGYGWSVFMGVFVQAAIAAAFLWMVHVTNIVSIEREGRLVVSDATWVALAQAESRDDADRARRSGYADERGIDPLLNPYFRFDANRLEVSRGGRTSQWQQSLYAQYLRKGKAGFVSKSWATGEGFHFDAGYRLLSMAMMLWWLSMVLQGEGMNLDSTRRRHPMWEWYLGFPIPQTVVFTAEALAPAVSNPFLLTAPVMFAVVAGWMHGSFLVGAAALPIAIPFVVAATLWAKALEVLVMLRSPVRSRGGWFAVLSAIGTLVMVGPILLFQLRALAFSLAGAMLPLLDVSPSSQWLLGFDGPLGWLRAITVSLAIGVALSFPAALLMRFATARGLESGFGGAEHVLTTGSFARRHSGWLRFLDDPLLRKEWLWLKRDRGALIQIFGVPLLLITTQLANFQNTLRMFDMTWNRLSGVIIMLATILLAGAVPRAMLSEGRALTLSLSWPRSLEDMLRVKLRVLFAMVTCMVVAGLGVVAWFYPDHVLGVSCVLLLWFALGLAVAEKAATMLRTPDSSGEIEPVPRGKFQPANFGNSTLALAVFTAQWQLAFAAIVMNWVLAVALWQRFRPQLAHLFDQGSEPDLRPPTLLGSVIAVVGLLELGVILGIPLMLWYGKDAAPFAQAIGYAIAAVVVTSIVVSWNGKRDLDLRQSLTLDERSPLFAIGPLLVGVAGGTALALVGIGYQHLLAILPWSALQEVLQRSAHALAGNPNVRIGYAWAAVGVAPWVEEFLFRGLMFRAMLSEWGLQRAALTSAAYFTILHPWPAWPMVFALGYANALLYARCRSLLPCILLHATYNAVLLYLSF